ncbi:MAG: hypothetical protein PVI06_20385 [Desulfobacterales bacterium]
MKTKDQKPIFFFISAFLWLTLSCGSSMADTKEIQISDVVGQELAYLLKFIGGDDNALNFEVDRVANLLHFVTQPTSDSVLHHSGESFGIPSAYYELDINRSLADILRYAYNSNIPYCTIAPSTVRICRLKETDQGQPSWPLLWKLLSDLDKPVIVRGVEHVVNTPDLVSGAYYSYDQDRALILFKYQGRNVFISVSKQRTKSEVGKKGLVLGKDDDWDYVYTGEEGLARSGLGWIRSYLYDSFGVAVYEEMDSRKPMVKLGIFRWVRAGWANINMVNRRHIHGGIRRFAHTFKRVIEHPRLPKDDELTRFFSQIESMPIEELRQNIIRYLANLKRRYKDTKRLSKKWRRFIFEDEEYLNRLKKEEMKSILFVENLKEMLKEI